MSKYSAQTLSRWAFKYANFTFAVTKREVGTLRLEMSPVSIYRSSWSVGSLIVYHCVRLMDPFLFLFLFLFVELMLVFRKLCVWCQVL